MRLYPPARRLLFRLDAEAAHSLSVRGLALASRSQVALASLKRAYALDDPRLSVTAFGLRFPNPLGLAAGMDKDGVALAALAAIGFGFVEVGSVTAVAQAGNLKPRLFRLPEDEAIVNRMGFNNRGAQAMARRLESWSAGPKIGGSLVGVNVGRSRTADDASTVADYEVSLRRLWGLADYLALNVSSPNTPGLRDLQRPARLAELLALVATLRAELGPWPALVKIAPDLDDAELAEVACVARDSQASGIIATNTTLSREGVTGANAAEAGGLSGKPLTGRALAVLARLRELSDLPLVAVGGIFSADDAIVRLAAGADLLQLYTAFVYRGPGVVGEILRGLLAEVERRGLANVMDLRGAV